MSKVEVMQLEIADIDTRPAAAVRAGLNAECVERYTECVLDGGELPAVDTFAHRDEDGGLAAFLGDGRHRLEAWRAAGHSEASCSVVWCETAAEAERRAWEHAAGANAGHGLPRSNEDKVAAVRAVIGRTEHEHASDNEIARLCKVSVHLARKVRKEMTERGELSGGASAAARNYKSNGTAAVAAAAPVAVDPSAGLVAQPEPDAAEPTPAEAGGAAPVSAPEPVELVARPESDAAEPARVVPVARPVREAVADAENEPDEPADGPVARPGQAEPPAVPRPPADQVRDKLGRVVPDHLADAFRAGRKLAKTVWDNRASDLALIRAAAEQPWGAAVVGVLNTVEAEGRSVAENVASAVPAYLCPDVDGEGNHAQPGRCRFCMGRVWLTRHNYHLLPQAQKRVCASKAGKDATQGVDGGAA